MKINATIPITFIDLPTNLHRNVEIQFGVPPDGNSSAAEKRNDKEASVRLAWYGLDGRFDPVSSAELPLKGLIEVVKACAGENFFSVEEATTLVKALQASIDKQSGDK